MVLLKVLVLFLVSLTTVTSLRFDVDDSDDLMNLFLKAGFGTEINEDLSAGSEKEQRNDANNAAVTLCGSKKDGNYRNPFDCTRYIACVAGTVAYDMPCPNGLKYNVHTDTCVFSKDSNCVESTGAKNFCTDGRRVYSLGETFINASCTGQCRCGAFGSIGCVSLCPPAPVSCRENEKEIKVKVPVPNSSCFCERSRCVRK